MIERGNVHTLPVLTLPKTVELEQRLARAEVIIGELHETLSAKNADIASLKDTVKVLQNRVVSLQAQLDHLFPRIGKY